MLLKTLSVVIVAAALLYRFGRLYIFKQKTADTSDWPKTEATIQSAAMELVERVGHLREELPFFTFSYVVDQEYYSGRFGLRVAEDRARVLMRDWINTKITVQYDSKKPSVFSLPDEVSVDGYRVSTVPEVELVSQH